MPQSETPCVIIPDRLVFTTLATRPANTAKKYCFSIDSEYYYQPFNNDFGPFNLAVVYRFCQKLLGILADPAHKKKTVVFYTSHDVRKRPNAAFLIGAFQVLYLGRDADEAFAPLAHVAENLLPFRDAGYGSCTYPLSLFDCLQGLYQGFCHGFVNFDNFDPDEYEFYERVENGDFNWIVPGRFLAFAGPHAARRVAPGVYPQLAPEDYFEIFRGLNISGVVRLNRRMYEASRFTAAGFDHHDLFFTDGSCPPEEILQDFLKIARTTSDSSGALAVHCKAGLGRTGTLIGCALMEQYRFTASEAIGWMRICRPGSVIGPQQYYLHQKQAEMWANGDRQGVSRVDNPIHVPSWATAPGLFATKPHHQHQQQHHTSPCSPSVDVAALHIGSREPPSTPNRRLSMTPERDPISTYAKADSSLTEDATQGDYLNARKLRRDKAHPIHLLAASHPVEKAVPDRQAHAVVI